MPTLQRPLAAPALRTSLGEEAFRLVSHDALQRTGRTARTLVKDGPLRVTLIALAAGGEIAEHHADGPVTVQVLRGTLRMAVQAEGDAGAEPAVWLLEEGDLLSLEAGVRHAVATLGGGVFLLTVAVADAAAPAW